MLFRSIGVGLVFAGLFSKEKRARSIETIVFTLCGIVPLAFAVISGTRVYNGWRHFYFVYPSLVLLMVHGLVGVHKYFKMRKFVAVIPIATAFYLLNCAFGIGVNYPQEHSFYNVLAGKNIEERFELDYWDLSIKEALNTILEREDKEFSVGCLNNPTLWGIERNYDKLINLNMKQLQAVPGTIILPRSQKKVEFKFPTVRDLKIVDDDPDIQLMARMIKVDDPITFVMSLKVLDFTYLLNACKNFDAGFDMHFELECPHCHGINPMQCLISESALFGQINMRDIISLEMKITKYLTYQISDNTAWPEFEMIAELTNVMIKEENEEMAKQESAAKAKAQAAQAQAHSRNFRTH